MMRRFRIGLALAAVATLVSSAVAREAEVTILLESFDGCGCLPPFDDPLSCPPCPDGVMTPHPDGDVCGPDSIDGDWSNFGWPADYAADTGTANQGFAAQCFNLGVTAGTCGNLPNQTFNDGAAAIIIYDNSAEDEPDSTHGSFARVEIDAARIAQGLPEPLPDGNSYIVYDYRRIDAVEQSQLVISTSFGANPVEPHPDATNSSWEFHPVAIPNDGNWYSEPILTYDFYIMSIGRLAVVIDLDPPGATPAIASQVNVCFDNLRYVYTAIVPDNEDVCDNGIDDDYDGLIDCDDPDCEKLPVCTGCQHDPVFDVDDDGDVDHEDFGVLQTCITGTGDPGGVFDSLSEDCKCMDRTGQGGVPDNAIDQQDIAIFEGCATGPDIADPNLAKCDD